MRWLLNLGVGIKFGIMVILILGVMTSSITYVYMRTHHKMQLQSLQEKGKTFGRISIHLSRLEQGGQKLVETLLQEILQDNDVLFAYLQKHADREPKLFINNNNARLNNIFSSNSNFNTADLIKTLTVLEEITTLKFALAANSSAPYELVLGMSHQNINDKYSAMLTEMLLTTVIIIGILCLIIYLDFLYIVMLPLKQLLMGLQGVASGNFDTKIEKLYADEIGELADNFNVMVDKLNASINAKDALTQKAQQQAQQLTNLNHSLDERVQESTRIMRDLHDDVGAELLTLVHRSDTQYNAEIARRALHNLRETIRGLGKGQSYAELSDAFDNWHDELKNRLDAAKIELDWTQEENPLSEKLNNRQWINLSRIIRENISNSIKHSQPRKITINCTQQQHQIRILIHDQGNAKNPADWQKGTGINNMITRASEINATLKWYDAENGHGIYTEILCPLTGS